MLWSSSEVYVLVAIFQKPHTKSLIISNYTVKVYQHFTDTSLKNLTTDIKYTDNVSVMV